MATIVTRAGKGSPLTNNEVDANFNNLNSDKVESSALGTIASQNANNVNITGGSISGISSIPSKTQTWEQSFLIEFPANQDYKVVIKAAVGRTITNVVTQLAAGTCSLTVKLDTTALGAGSAISVTTTEADTAYTTNNVLTAGQDITLTVASASSAQRLSVTLYGSLTLS